MQEQNIYLKKSINLLIDEKKLLQHWTIEQIYNHNKKKVGQIIAKIQ